MKPIISIALADEGHSVPDAFEILQTGVGKVNAAMKLARVLARAEQLPAFVLNLGSCGGHKVPINTVVWASSFHQADMDVSPLGFEVGITPFDAVPGSLAPSMAKPDASLLDVACFTADRFETNANAPVAQLFDMEAFALAKVCGDFGVPFGAVKYVTDAADGSAPESWTANLTDCKQALKDLLDQLAQS